MIPNGVIEVKTLEMTNESILIQFYGDFLKYPNKIFVKMSLVLGDKYGKQYSQTI